jgi:DNA-directed RNA polymerase subunit M/transcription elongation factor TFIIS
MAGSDDQLGFAKHRSRVTGFLAKALADSARRADPPGCGPPPPYAPAHVAKVAARLESACAARPGASTRAGYNEEASRVIALLCQPYGVFGSSTVGRAVCDGVLPPDRAVAFVAPPRDTPQRDEVRAALYRALRARADVSDARAEELAVAVERSCYNHVIEYCVQSAAAYTRNWESEDFVNLYSARCGTVLAHLDPRGSVTAAYGAHALDALLAGTMSAEEIGAADALTLNPSASEALRAELDTRSRQVVKQRVSTMFRCPKCGVKRCTYREAQTRSADEAQTILCRCLNCDTSFEG